MQAFSPNALSIKAGRIAVLSFALLIVPLVQADRPSLQAKSLSSAPLIDGQVNDDVWQGLPAATGFTQVRPFEGQPASQRTEVFVGYTDDALYIAVICHDEQPTEIVVSDSRRDSSMADTDSF